MTNKESEFYYKGKYEESLVVIATEKRFSRLKNYAIIFMASIFVLIILISAILAYFSPDQKTEVKNQNQNTQELKYNENQSKNNN